MRFAITLAPRMVLAATLSASVWACDSATGPSVPLDASVTIQRGDSVRLAGTSIRVTFVGVEGDSRCPADAVCIQGGDAIVHLRVDDDGVVRTIELHTGNLQPVRISGLTFRLEQLLPYPFSSRTIAPDEYRATVRVTR